MHKQQHDKLTQRGGHTPKKDLLIFDAYNKVDDHGHRREKHAPRHTFPIEHEEESRIDQG